MSTIQVGDRVVIGKYNKMIVRAINDGKAWCQYDDNLYYTQDLKDLKKLEPQWHVTSACGHSKFEWTKESALRKAEDILDKYNSVTIKYIGV